MAKNNPNTVSKTAPVNKVETNKKMAFSTEDKICFGLLLLLLAIIAQIRAGFALIPFERDEGIYSYFGKLILEGAIPYKDFYEQKFPGLFYFYGMMVYLCGDTVKGMHTGFMYLNLITITLLYFSSRKLFSPVAGLITAITYAFVSLTPSLSGFTVQAEHGVVLFISLGLFFFSLYNETRKWYYNFLMGFSFGLAFMTKTSGIFLLVWGGLTFIITFVFSKERKFKELLSQVVIYSVAAFMVIGFFFLIIYLQGSFNDMVFWAYEIPKSYVNKIPLADGIKYFGYTRDAIISTHQFFWIHGLLAVAVCFLKQIPWRMKLIALALLFFSFCTIVPGYYFYGHYWIQTIPGLSILAGLTYHGIISLLRSRFNLKKESIKYAYLALFVVFTFKHVNSQKSYYYHPNYERILRVVYGTNPFPESMEIANYINANSKPEDGIVLIGSEPEIYFYTHKKAPSRHSYFSQIVTDVPQHKIWQREFVSDVEKAKPRYLVFFNHVFSLLVQPNTDRYVFEWLNKYTTENYHIIGVADMVDGMPTNYVWKEALMGFQPKGQSVIYIYERNTATPPATTNQTPNK